MALHKLLAQHYWIMTKNGNTALSCFADFIFRLPPDGRHH